MLALRHSRSGVLCVMQFPIARRLGEPAEVGTLQEYVASMKPNQPGLLYEEGLKTLPCSQSWELLLWGFQVGPAEALI